MSMNNLPKCYIFDLDGTVAHRVNRSPYDWSRVGEDIPDEKMQYLFESLHRQTEWDSTLEFIAITGRDEICRDDTWKWLSKFGEKTDSYFSKLYMRPSGNKELDAILKMKLYKENIEGRYEVIAVFEDSDRCTKMYREILGLTCLQVASGTR